MWAQFSRRPMMSGPCPDWMAAAVLGWTSLALTNSMLTVAPVSFMKLSSICFLKKGSASGMKLDHCRIDRVVPLRLTGAFTAGAAAAGLAAGLAASAGLAAAGLSAGLAAGAAGAVVAAGAGALA